MTHYLVYWSAGRSRWIATSLLTGQSFVIEDWNDVTEREIYGDESPDTLREQDPPTLRTGARPPPAHSEL
ncbi:hypothetical protein EPN90_04305 [Patescibacteria group bacterium]|nr:MAG: hypothetical protein EPN90_04305 [Patescibacteria group bacterium]